MLNILSSGLTAGSELEPLFMVVAVIVGIIFLLSLISALFGKALENKGIIGDIANILRWVIRHWWLFLVVFIIALAMSGRLDGFLDSLV